VLFVVFCFNVYLLLVSWLAAAVSFYARIDWLIIKYSWLKFTNFNFSCSLSRQFAKRHMQPLLFHEAVGGITTSSSISTVWRGCILSRYCVRVCRSNLSSYQMCRLHANPADNGFTSSSRLPRRMYSGWGCSCTCTMQTVVVQASMAPSSQRPAVPLMRLDTSGTLRHVHWQFVFAAVVACD